MAAWGSRVVIGRDRADDLAPDGGSATVFRRVGLHFRPEVELTSESPGPSDGFGAAVAIDRLRIVVGASRDDDPALDSGSADVFDYRDDVWTRSAHLVAPDASATDWFGHSVAVSGDLVVVGAYGDDDRGEKCGAAYLWRGRATREAIDWTVEVKLAPEDLKAGDWFGFACACDGAFVAIGAPRDDGVGESAGCVRIYRRQRGEWHLDTVLRPPANSVTSWFGYSLALAANRLVVGAPGQDTHGESSGSIYLYERRSEEWNLVSILTPHRALAEAQFGAAVATADDLLAVGKLWAEDGEVESGRAWIFGPTRTEPTPRVEPTSPSTQAPRSVQRHADPRAPVAPAAPGIPEDREDTQRPNDASSRRSHWLDEGREHHDSRRGAPIVPSGTASERTSPACVGVRGPSP